MKIDKLEDINEKSLSKMVGLMFDRFIIDIPVYSISGLFEKWKPFIDKHEKYYKDIILQNQKARSGIFISQIKGTSIDDFVKNEFKYTVKRNKGRKRGNPNYTKEKYMKLCGFACILHLRKYGRITGYAIRHILMCVFLTYFDRELYLQLNNSKDIMDDITETEKFIIETDEHDLPGYSYEVDKSVLFYRANKKNKTKKGRPKMPNALNELTECLTGEESGKMEQYEVISNYFGISQVCARKWMKILTDRENELRKRYFSDSGIFKDLENEVNRQNH
jgi:hypothetical protein